MLIVVEGVDGSGKTSVANELAKQIHGMTRHFPQYDGPWGAEIKDWLQRDGGGNDPAAFQAMVLANMYASRSLLEMAHEGPGHLILSRYLYSAFVYGPIGGVNVDALAQSYFGLPTPQLAVLLDIEPGKAHERLQLRDGENAERYENIDALEKAVIGYRRLWSEMEDGASAIPPARYVVTLDTRGQTIEDLATQVAYAALRV